MKPQRIDSYASDYVYGYTNDYVPYMWLCQRLRPQLHLHSYAIDYKR
jgi:hypothetical protein